MAVQSEEGQTQLSPLPSPLLRGEALLVSPPRSFWLARAALRQSSSLQFRFVASFPENFKKMKIPGDGGKKEKKIKKKIGCCLLSTPARNCKNKTRFLLLSPDFAGLITQESGLGLAWDRVESPVLSPPSFFNGLEALSLEKKKGGRERERERRKRKKTKKKLVHLSPLERDRHRQKREREREREYLESEEKPRRDVSAAVFCVLSFCFLLVCHGLCAPSLERETGWWWWGWTGARGP